LGRASVSTCASPASPPLRHDLVARPARRCTCHRRSGQRPAGIGHYHPHDLRHRYASVQIARGIPVTLLAAQLGHSRNSMTLDTYSHVLARCVIAPPGLPGPLSTAGRMVDPNWTDSRCAFSERSISPRPPALHVVGRPCQHRRNRILLP